MDNYILYHDRLAVLPVIHNRIPFGQMVLAAFAEFHPGAIAVELAPSFEKGLCTALSNLNGRTASLGLVNLKTSRPNTSGFANTYLAIANFNEMHKLARRKLLDQISRFFPGEEAAVVDEFSFFDSIVWIFETKQQSPNTFFEFRSNISGTDDGYVYSFGYYQAAEKKEDQRFNRPLGGRVWFAPSVFTGNAAGDENHQERKIKEKYRDQWVADHFAKDTLDARQKIYPEPQSAQAEQEVLLKLAIDKARHYVIYVSTKENFPSQEMLDYAAQSNKPLFVLDLDDFPQEKIAFFKKNEITFSPDPFEKPFPETLQLHAGDAFITAILLAVNAEKPISVSCIDLELNHTQLTRSKKRYAPKKAEDETDPIPDVYLPPDELLREWGITKYHEQSRAYHAAYRMDEDDNLRESCMAAYLQALLKEGKKVLFVCGALHWDSIKQKLDTNIPLPLPIENSLAQASESMVCMSSLFFGNKTTELPYIVYCWERARKNKTLAAEFSREVPLQLIYEHFFRTLRRAGVPVSNRRLQVFFNLIQRLCALQGILTPNWQILKTAAELVFGRQKAWLLMSLAFRYPAKCPKGVPRLSDVHFENGILIGTVGDQKLEIISRSETYDWVVNRQGKISISYQDGNIEKDEEEIIGDPPPPPPGEHPEETTQDLWTDALENLALRAKIKAAIVFETRHSEPIKDIFSGQVDIRSTIRSRVKGENKIFRWVVEQQQFKENDPFALFDPVVFLFNDVKMFKQDYSLYLDYHEEYQICYFKGYPKSQYEFAVLGVVSFVPLLHMRYSNRVKNWIEQGERPFIPSTSNHDQAIKGALQKLPDAHQPHSWQEKLLLAGLAYSRKHILLVADQPPSAEAHALARLLNRRIYYVPLQAFDPHDIEMARTLRMVPLSS